nr:YeeE/YedE family protein [Oceanococcus sp. HetDA_MAG_MS8]
MDTTAFTPLTGLAGGLLIGLSAVLLLLANGRIAGISGIVGGLLAPARGEWAWRLLFVVGLVSGAAVYMVSTGSLGVSVQAAWPVMAAAGLLVGIGTRLGSGCTSGHGVCGIGRLSARSMIATIVFMATAGTTVFIVRHVVGGGV